METDTGVTRIVRLEGRYRSASGDLARHTTRIEITAGSPVQRVLHTLTWSNPRDAALARLRYQAPRGSSAARMPEQS